MKNIAIILARSGSKRIKDKNIKLVAGQPLLFYPIDCAKQVPLIDKIVLSTDSEQYKKIVENYGIQVIMRPKNIAGDNSKSEAALLHSLEVLEAQGEKFDNVIMMQPSNPIVDPKDITTGLELMANEGSSSIVTYTDFKGFFINDDDLLARPMSQAKEVRKLESGAFWITNVAELKKNNNRICKPVSYLKINDLSAIDIDTQYELEIAEVVLEREQRIKLKSYYKKRPYLGDYKDYYGNQPDPDGVIRNITSQNEVSHRGNLAKDEIAHINQLSKRKDKQKILDLGCGTGGMSSCFDNGYEKYGLEIDESVTDLTRQAYDIDKLHIGILDKQTFKDSFFDVIFCFHVIEHVPDPVEFVKNIHRILKTHGKLVISTPNFDSALAQRFGDNFRMLHDESHCSLFGEQGLKDLLIDFGFQVDYIDNPFFDTEYFTMDNLERLFDTSKVSPPFYGNIMSIYATKK